MDSFFSWLPSQRTSFQRTYPFNSARTVVSVLPAPSHPIVAMEPTDKCSRCLKKTIGDIEILPEDSNLVLSISDCARGGDHHWVSIAPSAGPGINRLQWHPLIVLLLLLLRLPLHFSSCSFLSLNDVRFPVDFSILARLIDDSFQKLSLQIQSAMDIVRQREENASSTSES